MNHTRETVIIGSAIISYSVLCFRNEFQDFSAFKMSVHRKLHLFLLRSIDGNGVNSGFIHIRLHTFFSRLQPQLDNLYISV